MSNYQGVIIEESLADKNLVQDFKILFTKVSLVTDKHKTSWLKQWTLHTVEIPEDQASNVAQKLSQNLDYSHGSAWYADFKNDAHHYIIFQNKVFLIDIWNQEQYNEAKRYGISLSIPDYQVDFKAKV